MPLFRKSNKTGKASRWQFFTRFDIPHMDIDSDYYLVRFRIIQTPFGSIYLHRIALPDSRPVLHDHPWTFLAIVVKGRGYTEVRLDKNTRKPYRRRVYRFNLMRRDDFHYIERLHSPTTWTLLFVGARRRTWGYLEPITNVQRLRDGSDRSFLRLGHGLDASSAWVWTEFDKHRFAEESDAALVRRGEKAHV